MLKTMIAIRGSHWWSITAYPQVLKPEILKKMSETEKHVENHGFLDVPRRKAVGFGLIGRTTHGYDCYRKESFGVRY